MDKCLITGGSGFIGSHIGNSIKCVLIPILTYNTSPAKVPPDYISMHLGVVDEEEVNSVITNIKPRVIIHTAAIKDLDYCETHQEETWRVNVVGTENLARACQKYNIKLIYISTDYVFEGTRGMYKETDEAHPTTFYGKTKLAGEQTILQLLQDYAICRTSGVYNYGSTFISWVIDKLKGGNTVNIFTDLFYSPTYVANLGEMILAIIKRDLTGIYHTAGCERISRYSFVIKVADIFSLDKNLIKPIASEGLHKRPLILKDSSLSTENTQRMLQIPFDTVDTGLKRMKREGDKLFHAKSTTLLSP